MTILMNIIRLCNRLMRPMPEHIKTARWGEKTAARTLRKKGFRILGRNVKIGRHDEIDIIARDCDTLVFVEVKTRRNQDFGRPVSAVDRHKIKALSRAASRYVNRLKTERPIMRFDVVEITGNPQDGPPQICHIENAFFMDNRYLSF